MVSRTDRTIIEQLRFLDVEIVNHPDFSPKILYLMWAEYKKSGFALKLEALKKDLDLLKSVELTVGRELARAKSNLLKNNDRIMLAVNTMQRMLEDALQPWEEVMGCSADDFFLRIVMAKTRHHFRKAVEIKEVDACIWTAASAVHLGKVSPQKFGLSDATDFKKLNADKSANNRARKKLAERVGRTCDRYISRLSELWIDPLVYELLDAQFEAKNLERVKKGLPVLLSDSYTTTRRQFIEAECRYFGLKK